MKNAISFKILSFIILFIWPFLVCGQINRALVLDGCSDWLEVPENDLLDFDESLTIECWIKPNCREGNNVFLSKQWCEGEFGYYLSVNEGRLFWSSSSDGFCSSGVNHHRTVLREITAGDFTHVAMVHTPNYIRLYINGELVNSEQNQGEIENIVNSSEPLRIGAYKNVAGQMTNHFSGLIDEIRIWNTELPANLIQQRMNQSLAGTENDLVLYFDMEEEGQGASLVLANSSSQGSSLNGEAKGFTDYSPYVTDYNTYDQKALLGEDISTCGFPITLEIADDDYKSILWSTGASSKSIQVNGPGTFTVVVETELCKLFEDQVVVELSSGPEVGRIVTICENDYLEINGVLVTENGIYLDTIFAVDGGCDTIRSTELRVKLVDDGFLEIETCQGSPITFLGEELVSGATETFTLTTEDGCDSLLNVEVIDVEAFHDSVTYLICPQDVFEIDGVFLSAGTVETLSYISTTGCDSTITVFIENLAVDESYLGEDVVVCDTAYVIQSPVSTTLWNSQVVSQDFQVTSSGLYTAVFVDEDGCSNIDSIIVELLDVPTMSSEVILCEGDSIFLDGVAYGDEGIFEVIVPSSGPGCDTLMEVTISILPTGFDSIALYACDNSTITFEDVVLVPGEVREFLFASVTGCDSILTVSVRSLETHDEEVQVLACYDSYVDFAGAVLYPNSETSFSYTNSLGCDSTITVFVEEVPLDETFLGPDITVCGTTYTLVGPVSDTEWNDLSIGPRLVIRASGGYSAAYTDTFGCTHYDDVEVEFIDRNIFMPNVFAPDSDRNNDCFGPVFSQDYTLQNYSFRIYSRWGEKLFETTLQDVCWDGTFKGASLTTGVFVWLLEGEDVFCGSSVMLTGDVTLLR